VPSLAEHREDLLPLIRHFVEHFAGQYGKKVRGATPRARLILERHAWPGNVRELENAIGHACMMAEGEEIDAGDLPESVLAGGEGAASATKAAMAAEPAAAVVEDGSLAEHERQLLVSALEKAGGNQSQAARALGIGRDALRYKMRKYGLL